MKLEKSNRSQSTSGLLKQRPLSLVFSRKSVSSASATASTSHLSATTKIVRVTSQDSIGNCSLNVNGLDQLDVDVDSDRMSSRLSPSQRELKSVSIETESHCRTSAVYENGSSVNGHQRNSFEPSVRRRIGSVEILDSRSFRGNQEFDTHPGLKPSYVHLACAVSGYSDMNRYNSKLREGFRSRDSSPVKIAWLRSPGSNNENHHSPLDRLKSPNFLASNPTSPRSPNDLSGLRSPLKVLEIQQQQEKLLQGGYGASTFGQGRSVSVDRARFFGTSMLTPVRPSAGQRSDPAYSAPPKVSNGSFTTENDCLDTDRERRSRSSRRANGHDEKLNGTPNGRFDRPNHSPVDTENREYAEAISTGKSFIQQRIERLYGQSRRRSDAEDDVDAAAAMKKHQKHGSGTVEQTPGTPPVFRHLRQEFREQLAVKGGVGTGLKVRMSEPAMGASPRAVSSASITLSKPDATPLIKTKSPKIEPTVVELPVGTVSSEPSFPSEDFEPTSTTDSLSESFTDSTAAQMEVHAGVTSPYSTLTIETAPFTEAISPSVSIATPNDAFNGDDVTTAGIDEVLTTEDSSVSMSATGEEVEELESTAEPATATSETLENTEKSSSDATESVSGLVKDGNYYYEVMDEERARLMTLIIQAESEVDGGDIPEESCGVLRATTGKARLVLDQKFAQFKSLCDKNLTPGGEGETLVTNEDLAGFWDVVYIQVDQVHDMFKDIEGMRNNNWKLPEAPTPIASKSVKRSSGTARKKLSSGSPAGSSSSAPRTPATSAAARKSEERRKQLLEAKRRMKREMEEKMQDKSEVGGGDAITAD